MVQVLSGTLSAAGCSSCRNSLLRAFTTVAGHSTRWSPTPFTARIKQQQHRYFLSTRRVHIIDNSSDGATQHTLVEEPEDYKMSNAEQQPVEEASTVDIPWYLQVGSPSTEVPSLSDRQKIPELPESAPEILQPLLQQISVDLGLDNLTLLDLRNLDPPAALGANLLMIIGTARSEKHLHVSADRLCRWLRSKYKLRPDADGLLGRQELKLKMKRKTRRSKLVGTGSPEDDADDGIRTGWVCVNIGSVNGAAGAPKELPKPEGFVGFGRRTDGVKIVVQMLVEEKRLEMDLERLWTGIVKRQSFPDVDGEHSFMESLPQSDRASDTTAHESDTSNKNQISNTTSFSPMVLHRRGFHTSAQAFSAISSPHLSTIISGTSLAAADEKNSRLKLDILLKSVATALTNGKYAGARQLLLSRQMDVAELKNDGWRKHLLHALRNHLEGLPVERAAEALGPNSDDVPPTEFLACFNSCISTCPSGPEFDALIWLQCAAEKLQNCVRSAAIFQLYQEYKLSGVDIPKHVYLEVLHSLLVAGASDSLRSEHEKPPAMKLVSQVLYDMQTRGEKLVDDEVFITLHNAVARYLPEDANLSDILVVPRDVTTATTTWNLPTQEQTVLQKALNQVMFALRVPFTRNESRNRLLGIYARQHDWVGFWAFWRWLLRNGEPRHSEMYACMFRLVADTNHQAGCMSVLRTWYTEMELENPRFPLQGELLDAVLACLTVADPEGPTGDFKDSTMKGEWMKIWRDCAEAQRSGGPGLGIANR